MTLRLTLLSLGLVGLGLAGCEGAGGGPSGNADLAGIADADPFEQIAYTVGHQTGEQFRDQDSSFSFERFRDGLRAGLNGDSVEIAYALGLQYGLQLRQDTVANLDPDVFLAGIREGLAGDSLRIPEAQVQRIQAAVEDSIQIRQIRSQARTNPQAQQRLQAIADNAVSADSFLTAVRSQSGIQETESGVLYTIDERGNGPRPTLNDRVVLEYVGQFANGQVFDRSPEGETRTLPVGGVVPGFQEALLDMNVGETRTIYLPPNQAYGLTGNTNIPPNSALQFTVTLVEIAEGRPQQMTLPPGFGQ